jgi:hypothetical protein
MLHDSRGSSEASPGSVRPPGPLPCARADRLEGHAAPRCVSRGLGLLRHPRAASRHAREPAPRIRAGGLSAGAGSDRPRRLSPLGDDLPRIRPLRSDATGRRPPHRPHRPSERLRGSEARGEGGASLHRALRELRSPRRVDRRERVSALGSRTAPEQPARRETPRSLPGAHGGARDRARGGGARGSSRPRSQRVRRDRRRPGRGGGRRLRGVSRRARLDPEGARAPRLPIRGADRVRRPGTPGRRDAHGACR